MSRHVEGYLRFTSGDRVTRLINVMGDNTFTYDDLGRLASSTPTGSSTPQLTWLYDRYGNRRNQHDVQNLGLPHIDLWYDQSRNHIVGYNQPSFQQGCQQSVDLDPWTQVVEMDGDND